MHKALNKNRRPKIWIRTHTLLPMFFGCSCPIKLFSPRYATFSPFFACFVTFAWHRRKNGCSRRSGGENSAIYRRELHNAAYICHIVVHNFASGGEKVWLGCDCVGVEKEERCICGWGETVKAAEPLQWSRTFFSEKSVGLYLRSNMHTTVFASVAYVKLYGLTILAIPRWKDRCYTRDLKHSIIIVFMPEAKHNSIHREGIRMTVTNLHYNTIYIA